MAFHDSEDTHGNISMIISGPAKTEARLSEEHLRAGETLEGFPSPGLFRAIRKKLKNVLTPFDFKEAPCLGLLHHHQTLCLCHQMPPFPRSKQLCQTLSASHPARPQPTYAPDILTETRRLKRSLAARPCFEGMVISNYNKKHRPGVLGLLSCAVLTLTYRVTPLILLSFL